MLGSESQSSVGGFRVEVSQNGGHSPEAVAQRCMEKLIYTSNEMNPVIRDQVLAYKDRMHQTVLHYIKEAIKSDRTTIYHMLVKAGHADVAETIRRM